MMLEQTTKEPREVLMARIKWLMSLRLVLATFSLGTAALVQITEGKAYLDAYLLRLYCLVGIVYCLSLLYAFLIRHIKHLEAFAYLQLILDTLLISGLISVTGGVRSDFSLFYYLSIIAAGIILYRRGGVIIASAGSILYTLMIALEYSGVIHTADVTMAPARVDGAASLMF